MGFEGKKKKGKREREKEKGSYGGRREGRFEGSDFCRR